VESHDDLLSAAGGKLISQLVIHAGLGERLATSRADVVAEIVTGTVNRPRLADLQCIKHDFANVKFDSLVPGNDRAKIRPARVKLVDRIFNTVHVGQTDGDAGAVNYPRQQDQASFFGNRSVSLG
jgi:hypothetical protein